MARTPKHAPTLAPVDEADVVPAVPPNPGFEQLRQAAEAAARANRQVVNLPEPIRLHTGELADRMIVRNPGAASGPGARAVAKRGGTPTGGTPTGGYPAAAGPGRRTSPPGAPPELLLEMQGGDVGGDGRRYSLRQRGYGAQRAVRILLEACNARWQRCDVKMRGVLVQVHFPPIFSLDSDALLAEVPRAPPLTELAADLIRIKRDPAEAILDILRRDEARLRRFASSFAGFVAVGHLFGLRVGGTDALAVDLDGTLVCTDFAEILRSEPVGCEGASGLWVPKASKAALRDRWDLVVATCVDALQAVALAPAPPPGCGEEFSFWVRLRACVEIVGRAQAPRGDPNGTGAEYARCLTAAASVALEHLRLALLEAEHEIFQDRPSPRGASNVAEQLEAFAEHGLVDALAFTALDLEAALCALLASQEASLRERGAEELGNLPREALRNEGAVASACLAPLLEDPSGKVRLAASRSFARLGQQPRARQSLNTASTAAATTGALLLGAGLEMRLDAVRTLARLGGSAAGSQGSVMSQAFRESSEPVPAHTASEFLEEFLRSGSVHAPGAQGLSVVPGVAGAQQGRGKGELDQAIRDQIVSAFISFGTAGARELERLLADTMWTVRLEALRSIARSPEAHRDTVQLTSMVTKSTEDRSLLVRLEAVRCLREIGRGDANFAGPVARLFCREALAAQLANVKGFAGGPGTRAADMDTESAALLRFEAFTLLVGAGERGEGEVQGLLTHSDQGVRQEALDALIRVASEGRGAAGVGRQPEAYSAAALQLLRDSCSAIRAGAARALALLRAGEGAAAEVVALFQDEQPEVRAAAARAMAAIGGGSRFVAELQDLFLREVASIRLAAADVRLAAFGALVSIGGITDEPTDDVAAAAETAADLLSYDNASVRCAAIHALGQISQQYTDASSPTAAMGGAGLRRPVTPTGGAGGLRRACNSDVTATTVVGLGSVLHACTDAQAQRLVMHILAIMGEGGACEVAVAMAGRGEKETELRHIAQDDATVLSAIATPAAQRRVDEKLRKYWTKLEAPGTGIKWEQVEMKSWYR